MSTILELDPRRTIIVAIFVLFLGKYLTSKVEVLREYNIPEPVSGGLIASLVFGASYAAFGLEFQFALDLRDTLLIVFFTTIGLSSKFSTLVEGGGRHAALKRASAQATTRHHCPCAGTSRCRRC